MTGTLDRSLGPVLLLLAALSFSACTDGPSPEQRPIRLGISPFQDTYLPELAKQKGWFSEIGLAVETQTVEWDNVSALLAGGSIDVAINNISSIIATHAAAPDHVYVYGFNTFDDGFALMIRPDGAMLPLDHFVKQGMSIDAAVQAAAIQLKGKTVITTKNTDMEQGVAAAARKGGLDFEKDIRILNYPPPEGLAKFLADANTDAYIGGITQRATALHKGMVELLTGAELGPAPINGYVTTRAFADERQEDLLKLLYVWFYTVNYVNSDLEQAALEMTDLLNKAGATGFTAADFKRFWNKLEHYPANPLEAEREILSPSGRNSWQARWEDCNSYFYDVTGRIPSKVAPEGKFIMPTIHNAFVRKYGAEPDFSQPLRSVAAQ